MRQWPRGSATDQTLKLRPTSLRLPSRGRFVVLSLVFCLIISAALTSNLARSKLVQAVPLPLSANASISTQIYFLFFKSFSLQTDAPKRASSISITHESFPQSDVPITSTPPQAVPVEDHGIRPASISVGRMPSITNTEDATVNLLPYTPENRPNFTNGRSSSAWQAGGRGAATGNDPNDSLSSNVVKDLHREQASASETFSLDNRTLGEPTSPISAPLEQHAWEPADDGLSSSPTSTSSSKRSRCDISLGTWVQDNSYPLYPPGSCPFVDEKFSCAKNGRPDTHYNRWKWLPKDCIIPRFNGTYMLERLRGKRLVFVGDSLNRNQWESMLCLLRESLANKDRISEIQGGRISQLPGASVFKFLDYDCRVELYTSHFLVDEEEGAEPTKFTVRLDRMDKSERRWRKANILVFNTGHWWNPDKIGEGDYFREGNTVLGELDLGLAYRKAITTWARWVKHYVNPAKTRIFFRGYSPVHYFGGQWNSGGQCHNETQPIFNELYLSPYPHKMQVVEEIVERMRVSVQILNITRLSDFRKDAHPALFDHSPEVIKDYQDCSHWCLPGLPDTWNELLYFSLL